MIDVLRTAVETGDWQAVPMAPDVVLRSSSEAGVIRVCGADAVRAHLSRPGPGEVLDWDADEWPSGAAVSFEWRSPSGAHDRRRWYAHVDGGSLTALWSYAARPRAGEPPHPVPPGVLHALGPDARAVPLEHGGNSGAALQRVDAGGESLVVKRTVPGGDWLARVTDDRGRTAKLFEQHVFAELTDVIDTGVVAVARDSGAAWVAMRDVSGDLIGDERLSRFEAQAVLRAAATMHHRFAGRPPEGLATLESRLGMSTPAVSEAQRSDPDLLPKQFELAWEAFSEAADADVASEVLSAVQDVGPLAAALRAAGPVTLVHGDLRDDNLGFDGERIILLDWDLATAGTPTVDFAWFLLQDRWRTDASHDDLETDFRAAEQELADDEVELGMLSGLVQYGWVLGHSAVVHPDPAENAWAEEELAWWIPRVRRALEHMGGAPR